MRPSAPSHRIRRRRLQSGEREGLRQVGSRAARSGARRVLTSTMTEPEKPVAQQVEDLGHRLVAAAGDQVLVARRVGAVGQVHVRHPAAEIPAAISTASLRETAVCERSSVVCG